MILMDDSVNGGPSGIDISESINAGEEVAAGDAVAALPADEDVLNLLLAREGDSVSINGSMDVPTVDVEEIVHERELGEKRVRLLREDGEKFIASREGGIVLLMGEESDGTVGESDDMDVEVGHFRVVDRSLGLSMEQWQDRENDVPIEQYREVRVDEDARPALADLMEWRAATWQIDERSGNGTWRQRRDEAVALAYLLSQGQPEPEPEVDGSFTIETVARKILQQTLTQARASGPFADETINALKDQIRDPGLADWSVDYANLMKLQSGDSNG